MDILRMGILGLVYVTHRMLMLGQNLGNTLFFGFGQSTDLINRHRSPFFDDATRPRCAHGGHKLQR